MIGIISVNMGERESTIHAHHLNNKTVPLMLLWGIIANTVLPGCSAEAVVPPASSPTPTPSATELPVNPITPIATKARIPTTTRTATEVKPDENPFKILTGTPPPRVTVIHARVGGETATHTPGPLLRETTEAETQLLYVGDGGKHLGTITIGGRPVEIYGPNRPLSITHEQYLVSLPPSFMAGTTRPMAVGKETRSHNGEPKSFLPPELGVVANIGSLPRFVDHYSSDVHSAAPLVVTGHDRDAFGRGGEGEVIATEVLTGGMQNAVSFPETGRLGIIFGRVQELRAAGVNLNTKNVRGFIAAILSQDSDTIFITRSSLMIRPLAVLGSSDSNGFYLLRSARVLTGKADGNNIIIPGLSQRLKDNSTPDFLILQRITRNNSDEFKVAEERVIETDLNNASVAAIHHNGNPEKGYFAVVGQNGEGRTVVKKFKAEEGVLSQIGDETVLPASKRYLHSVEVMPDGSLVVVMKQYHNQKNSQHPHIFVGDGAVDIFVVNASGKLEKSASFSQPQGDKDTALIGGATMVVGKDGKKYLVVLRRGKRFDRETRREFYVEEMFEPILEIWIREEGQNKWQQYPMTTGRQSGFTDMPLTEIARLRRIIEPQLIKS